MSKMQLIKSLVVIFSILRLNFAAVRSCIKEDVKNTICVKSMGGGNTTYVNPFYNAHNQPLVLNTTIDLKEVIEINEKDSSIMVRVVLLTEWRDPRIGLSNGSTG